VSSIASYYPCPVLTTPRLVLRQLGLLDAAAIYQLHSDEQVIRYTNRNAAQSLADAQHFVKLIIRGCKKDEWLYWAITLPETPAAALGTICLWNFSPDHQTAELGYELLPRFQGHGLMAEAVHRVLAFARETLHLQRVSACVQAGNVPSIRVLQRQGFTFSRYLSAEEKPAEEQAVAVGVYELVF